MEQYEKKLIDELIERAVEPLVAAVVTPEDKRRVARAFGETAILAATFYKGDITEVDVKRRFAELMATYVFDIMGTRPVVALHVLHSMYDALNFPNKAVEKLTAISN